MSSEKYEKISPLDRSISSNVLAFSFSFVSKHKLLFITLLITSVVAALDESITPLMLDIVLKNVEKLIGHLTTFSQVQTSIFQMICVWVLFDVLYRIGGIISSYIYPMVEAEVRMFMLREIQYYKPSYFSVEAVEGSVENAIADTADGVQEIIEFVISTLIPGIFAILACVGQIVGRNRFIGVLISGWAIFHLLVSVLLLKKSIGSSSNLQEAQNKLATKIIDSLMNRNVTLQYNQQSLEYHHINKYQKEEVKAHRHLLLVNEGIKFALSFFVIVVCIFLFLHILSLLKGSKISVSDLVFLYTVIFSIVRQVWQIGTQLGPFVEALGQCSKGLSILNEHMKLRNLNSPHLFNPQDDSIEFRNVTLYENGKCILKNVSFHIKNKEKVALIGVSGSGKTSILKLILGFTSEYEGEIFIGKVNVKHINSRDIRDHIGILDQRQYWFDLSVKDNLLYGHPHATEQELKEVCEVAGIYSYIQDLPNKWNSHIHRDTISGGQLQRLCLARMLLRNPKITLYDELSTGLDVVIREFLGGFISRDNRTIIMINHDLYYRHLFDRVIVIGNGQIMDMGTDEELTERCALYQSMLQVFYS